MNQVWFQTDFNFSRGIFYIFSPSSNFTSDDLWPHDHMKVPILQGESKKKKPAIIMKGQIEDRQYFDLF